MKRSLKGKKILITREASQASIFSEQIKEHGGIPMELPMLRIDCRPRLGKRIDLKDWDWIFFTSAHGVNCFFQHINHVDELSHCKFATVGHKTEESLIENGCSASFIPSVYNAEMMAKEFFRQFPDANNILLVRGNLSRKLLVEEVKNRQLSFETVVVYDTKVNKDIKEVFYHTIIPEEIDVLTFTSPSTVRAFIQIGEGYDRMNDLLNLPCICIGTTTEKAAIEAEFEHTFVPKEFTIESMVEKMVELYKEEIL